MRNNAVGPRVVIIGAGANVGLGCALAASGCELVLADIEPSKLNPLKRAAPLTTRYCDVMSEASVLVFANDLVSSGNFDILINAAGNGYVRTLGMNRLSRALLPAMRRTGKRQLVVNVAPSKWGADVHPFAHAGSPEAFLRLSQSFADCVRHCSVGILTVVPDRRGSTATGRGEVLVADLGSPAAAGRTIMAEALARIGRPTEAPCAAPIAQRRGAGC